MPINFSQLGLASLINKRISFKKTDVAPLPDIAWNTAAGSLGTRWDVERKNNSITYQISSNAQSYALSSGSSLPSGMSLNQTTGVISGTSAEVAADTTYSFSIDAFYFGSKIGTRSFSFTQKPPVIQTITTSTTFNKPSGPTKIELLMLGGGGGGGNNRGNGAGAYGGGGGIVYHPSVDAVSSAQSYSIVVGGGGGSACCNNQSGCSGGNSTAFGGTAGGGGGGQSESNGNCGGGTASTMTGATYTADGRSGCGFGSNSGYATYTSSITGTSVSYYANGAPNQGDGTGCNYQAASGKVIIRY